MQMTWAVGVPSSLRGRCAQLLPPPLLLLSS